MKPIHYIIAASVTLNAALFIYIKPFAPRAPTASTTAQTKKSGTQTARSPNLQTASPEQLKQELAALDFPPDIIKAIITNKVFNDSQDRQNAVLGYDDHRYWQTRRGLWVMVGSTKIAEIAGIQWGTDNTLIKLFGSSLDDAYRQPEILRQRFGDLPDAKLQALDGIWEQTHAQYVELMEKSKQSGTIGLTKDQWDAVKLQDRENITKTLTPDELLEYDLRNSAASQYLGDDTKLFDITEQEYRDMFSVYQKYYNIGGSYGGTSEFSSEQDFQAYKDAQLQQILGPDRYADFQQASNPAYEKLNLITARLDLPISAAREVVSVQTDLTQRAAAIDADASLTNDQRAAQYNALAQEAQARITQTLGKRGYSAYRDNSQNWIQNLESGKPPPSTAK